MFIKKIDKGQKGGKVYSYNRLCHSIRIVGKTCHDNLLNLGTLKELQVEEHKMLANRIEDLYIGNINNGSVTLGGKVQFVAAGNWEI